MEAERNSSRDHAPASGGVRTREAAGHTPGPWRLSRTRRYVMNGYGAPWVCEVCVDQPEWEANARLLAAAPEMFHALWTIAQISTDLGAQDYAQKAIDRALTHAPEDTSGETVRGPGSAP